MSSTTNRAEIEALLHELARASNQQELLYQQPSHVCYQVRIRARSGFAGLYQFRLSWRIERAKAVL
jgi:hypothetical protein